MRLGFYRSIASRLVLKRYFSYPPPPHKKRGLPPPFFEARALEQIDSCPVTSAARIRSTIFLTYHWISSFKNKDRKHQSLDSLLRNRDLWICAYQRACYNNRLWSPVSSIAPRTLETLELLMEAIAAGNYGWGGTKVVFVCPPQKMAIEAAEVDDKVFQDEIVQEVLLMLLEPIYEAKFSRRLFGHRPGRGVRECLRFVHGNFGDVSWTIKGDLSKLFDHARADLFARVLKNVVRDEKVGELICKGLRTRPPPAAVPFTRLKRSQKRLLEFEARPSPFWMEVVLGFAPVEARASPDWGCCRKIGSFLANVFLSELDSWIEKQAEMFYRAHDPSIGLDFGCDDEQRKPNNARKIEYVRFGSHFLISVRGSKDDAVSLMEKCKVFCKQVYHRESEFEPPRGIWTPTPFLGHLFFVTKKLKSKWEPSSINRKGTVSKVEKTVFCIDGDVGHAVQSLKSVGVLDDDDDTRPCMRLFHEDQDHNNSHVNKILRALSDLYKHSTNRSEMCGLIGYLFRSSLAKMYAAKYKLRTQIRVAKAASMDLDEPMRDPQRPGKELKSVPEPLELVHSVPEAVPAPIEQDWKPVHERTLRSFARLIRPELFERELDALADELGTRWKI